MFFLAEKLRMTVRDLQERMTREELLLWAGYLINKRDVEEQAQRRAAMRRR